MPGWESEEAGARLLASPPPYRRDSCTLTVSDVTLPNSSSYQNLLSPLWTNETRAYVYTSDDAGTPPNEQFSSYHLRPKSAQVPTEAQAGNILRREDISRVADTVCTLSGCSALIKSVGCSKFAANVFTYLRHLCCFR